MSKLIKVAKKVIIPPYEEQEYAKALFSLVAELKAKVKEELAHFKMVRTDDTVDDLDKLITTVQSFIGLKVAKTINSLKVRATKINKLHLQAFMRAAQDDKGLSVSLNSQDINEQLRLWIAENTLLIKSLPETTLSKLQITIFEAARIGESPRSLAKNINKIFKVSQNRARLIARDQLGKLYGSLTRSRNLSIGIKTYIFSTSNDERVRKNHQVLNGKICSWLNAEVYKDGANDNWQSRSSIGGVLLHPGQDFQCRCTSKAIVAGIL